MRQHGLLAPRRLGPPNGDPAHAGTIITDRPDVMWGTDATRFYTEQDGWCWFFGAIDHGIDELLGWHVAKLGDRWAALEPIRQGVRHAFGDFRKDVARGLAIRCDWGPQYIADAWINEVKWLGITISPSYVGEPQCNGVIERFMRTLKEQCLYLHRFQTLEEARRIIAAVHRPLQPRVADRAPRLPDAGPGAGRGVEGRGVRIRPIRLDAEGRSASRSAFDEGGRYLGIPRNATFSGLTSVQGTGCGTRGPILGDGSMILWLAPKTRPGT